MYKEGKINTNIYVTNNRVLIYKANTNTTEGRNKQQYNISRRLFPTFSSG